MRARNREINIFNMSLLDVLCGALGAFCFMMLVTMPHYGSTGQSNTPGPPTPPAETPRNGTVSQAYAEKLKKRIDYLERDVERLNRDLGQEQGKTEMRDPITVQVWWTGGSHDLDLYVRETFVPKPPPRPDLSRKQGVNFPGDARTDQLDTPGSEIWMMRDTPAGDYEVYLKLMDNKPTPPAVAVISIATTKTTSTPVGLAVLSQENRLFKLGILRVAAGHKVSFVGTPEFLKAGLK